MNKLRTNLFIFLGTLCVIFGVIGMALPILPTTPFLLLAAFFYARSSKRFYTWLMTNRVFGEYLRNYQKGRGVPLRQKVIVIGILWLTIGTTSLLFVSQLWLKIILICIAVGVTTHLVRTKTYHAEIPPMPLFPETDISQKPS